MSYPDDEIGPPLTPWQTFWAIVAVILVVSNLAQLAMFASITTEFRVYAQQVERVDELERLVAALRKRHESPGPMEVGGALGIICCENGSGLSN
jgi:hypothetical protein